jgi:hypothetical protein
MAEGTIDANHTSLDATSVGISTTAPSGPDGGPNGGRTAARTAARGTRR